MKWRTPTAGFSLIELTIVMTIVGLLLATAASAMTIYQKRKILDATRDAAAELTTALTAFAEDNGRLPCPAPRDATPDSANYAKESCASGTVIQTAGARDTDGNGTKDPVLIGTVPTRTLNVADSKMLDGYHNRFSYAVTKALTVRATFTKDRGAIAIVDLQNNPKVTPPGSAGFLIVSHGSDEIGAFTRSGVLVSPCTGNTRDVENCDDDSTFIDTLDISTADGPNHYDDYAHYEAKLPVPPWAGLGCTGNKRFAGFDELGKPICSDLSCPAKTVFTGLDTTGQKICSNITCPSNLVFTGLDAAGQKICVKPKLTYTTVIRNFTPNNSLGANAKSHPPVQCPADYTVTGCIERCNGHSDEFDINVTQNGCSIGMKDDCTGPGASLGVTTICAKITY